MNYNRTIRYVSHLSAQSKTKPSGFWQDEGNIHKFLMEIKGKYNINTPEDWNLISQKQIQSNGGWSLLKKYSIYQLKCMACPEGKSIFISPKPSGYWKNKENILKFLKEIKEKYNIQTPEDWNLISQKQIQSNGGRVLLNTYSLYQLKCMACPEGELIFKSQLPTHWENKENIYKFLEEIKEKYNIQTPEDWNLISQKQIKSHGGWRLLKKFSIFELKCMACPEGKSIFKNEKQSPGYWENKENIEKFLEEIKEKYNLQTPEDWNFISKKQIQFHGGSTLANKYSMYQLKCMACPEGKLIFKEQSSSSKFRNSESNRNSFFENLKQKYQLKTLEDWKRLSKTQIISQGGNWLFSGNHDNNLKIKIQIEDSNENITKLVSINELLSESIHKRSAQRFLFLEIQKLFPGEEMVEDYFHSEISRETGCSVQFDIFMVQKKIAIEYHGRQHYEDIPSAFSNLELYKSRDLEKEKLCNKYGIKLIVIPYWWDNNLESLKETLRSKINL